MESPINSARCTLSYDLRKMKAHGLLDVHTRRYAYGLTGKGIRIALFPLGSAHHMACICECYLEIGGGTCARP